ncbi:MAG TPA: cupredoxin domain-containing protein [Acidimicrobiales bacterium]|nr:cupredoxin domain-containing protein [Acidimicrobiales bacterium]
MRAVLLIVAAVLASTGCGRQHGSEQARLEPNGEQTITVDAHDMAFRPKTIGVEPHGEVVVTVRNTGRLSHTFTTYAPAGDVVLAPGDTRTVRLPANAPVHFFCRFHEASGMRGSICPAEGECRSA